MNLNPLNLNTTGAGPGNAIQSNTAAPTANANVGSYSTGANSLLLTWPIPVYSQPKAVSDNPSGVYL